MRKNHKISILILSFIVLLLPLAVSFDPDFTHFDTIYNPFTGQSDYYHTANYSGLNITADDFLLTSGGTCCGSGGIGGWNITGSAYLENRSNILDVNETQLNYTIQRNPLNSSYIMNTPANCSDDYVMVGFHGGTSTCVALPIEDGTTSGQMTFWNGTKWVHTETNELFWDDVNKRVGIRTATPTKTFQVNGDFGVSGTSYLETINSSGNIYLNALGEDETVYVNKDLYVEQHIYLGNDITHIGDTDTRISYLENILEFWTGGLKRMTINNSGVFTDGDEVSTITQSLTIAQAFDSLQGASLLTDDGKIGKTTSIIQRQPHAGSSPNVYITSLGDNNMIYLNDVYNCTLNLGENFEYDGNLGDKIVSEKGHSGASIIIGNHASHNTILPLNYEAMADTFFFVYAFRSTDPFRFFVSTGAVASDVEVKNSVGSVVDSASLGAFETVELNANAIGEYSVIGTQPFFLSTGGRTSTYETDYRFIPPPSVVVIGHIRSSEVNAVYDNTNVTCYSRRGVKHNFLVSPGSPYHLKDHMATEHGKTHYDPDGYGICYANAPIAILSGADGNGYESTSWMSPDALGNLVGIPLEIDQSTSADHAGISFASQFPGTVEIYDRDLDLLTTLTLEKSGSYDKSPYGVRYTPEASDKLGGGGYAKSDVPIYVVANFKHNWGNTAGEETVLLGIKEDGIETNNIKSTGTICDVNGCIGRGGDTSTVAQAFDSLQSAGFSAEEGNVGKTTSIIQAIPDAGENPNVFITSVADNNMISLNGVYNCTLNTGEQLEYKGSLGDVITSAKGHSGSTLLVESASVHYAGVLPFNYEALADTQFFTFIHRQTSPASFAVSTGAVPADVELKNGAGTVTYDSASMSAFETVVLIHTSAQEYQIVATQPVFVSQYGSGYGGKCDVRFVAPLSVKILGHIQNARISALYSNTNVTCHSRRGETHNFLVSPGSPYNLYSHMTGGSDYDPQSYAICTANGPIAGFSGADSSGGDATSWVNPDILPTVVGIPMKILYDGSANDAGISIASQYAGKIKVYDRDLDLIGEYNLTRTGSDQRRPTGYRLSVTSGDAMKLGGGGYVIADVPIYVVANYHLSTWGASAEETVLFGIRDFQPELRKDADGDLRLRRINGDGVETWEIV